MGLAASVELPTVVQTIGTWSLDKTREVISTFFSGNYGFSLTIKSVRELTGLQEGEAKELRSFLSVKRVSTVNSTTMITVIIFVAAKRDMTLQERKRTVFRLIDYKEGGFISEEGMEILLYRVSVACSLLLNSSPCKSSEVKHLRKIIFRCHHQQVGGEGDALTLGEYMSWADEALRGGDRYSISSSAATHGAAVTTPLAVAVEDLQEYFLGFISIFRAAASSASEGIRALEGKCNDKAPTSSSASSCDGSLMEGDDEDKHRDRYEAAVKRVKAASQHWAGVQIESLIRHRKEVYNCRICTEKKVAARVAAVASVRRKAEWIAESNSASTLICLEKCYDAITEQLSHVEGIIERLREQSLHLSLACEEAGEVFSGVKLRRSLLAERLTVLSNELRVSIQLEDSLRSTINALPDSLLLRADHGSVIQLNRLEAKQEMVKGEKARLKNLLDSTALKSGELMNEQIKAEKNWRCLKSSLEEVKQQLSGQEACRDVLETRDRRVAAMIALEMNDSGGVSCEYESPAVGDSSSALASADLIQSHAQLFTTSIIELACLRVEEKTASKIAQDESHAAIRESSENQLKVSHTELGSDSREANESVRSQTKREIKHLQKRKKRIMADMENAKVEEELSMRQSVQRKEQFEAHMAELMLQQQRLESHLEEGLQAQKEAIEIRMKTEKDIVKLNQSKMSITADIESAQVKMEELGESIEASREKMTLTWAEAEEQKKTTLALVEGMNEQVARLKLEQERVEKEVVLAQRKADVIRQEAEESRVAAMRVARDSREEMNQLRRDQEAAEAQVEAVVEMTENMIAEAEQEKARLSSEREEALECAYEARCRVEALEAELSALKENPDVINKNIDDSSEKLLSDEPRARLNTMSDVSLSPRSVNAGSQRISSTLPDTWEKCTDNDGRDYYINKSSGESTRSPPKCIDVISSSHPVSAGGRSSLQEGGGRVGESHVDRKERQMMSEGTDQLLLEEGRRLHGLAVALESKSLLEADEKQRELDELCEATSIDLEKQTAHVVAARIKAKEISDGFEAAQLKASNSILEANSHVDWTQLLLVQSNDEVAQLTEEKSSICKDVESASLQALVVSTGMAADKLVLENELRDARSERGQCLSNTNDEHAALQAAATFKGGFDNGEVTTASASSSRGRRVSLEWEECCDDEGNVFYFNKITEVSSWTKPKGFGISPHDGSAEGSYDLSAQTEWMNRDGKKYRKLDSGYGEAYWINDDTGSVCDCV